MKRKESEWSKNRDKKIVIVKLIIQRENLQKKHQKHQVQEQHQVPSFGKSIGVLPLVSNLGVGIQLGALMWSHQVTGF
jgi:hypothetical protein